MPRTHLGDQIADHSFVDCALRASSNLRQFHRPDSQTVPAITKPPSRKVPIFRRLKSLGCDDSPCSVNPVAQVIANAQNDQRMRGLCGDEQVAVVIDEIVGVVCASGKSLQRGEAGEFARGLWI